MPSRNDARKDPPESRSAAETESVERLHGFLVAHAAAATPRLLTPIEVAKWLGVSPGWVRDHATRKRPHLRAVKLGKLLRFRQKDVEEFIETP